MRLERRGSGYGECSSVVNKGPVMILTAGMPALAVNGLGGEIVDVVVDSVTWTSAYSSVPFNRHTLAV